MVRLVLVPTRGKKKTGLPSEFKYIFGMWGTILVLALLSWGLEILNNGINSSILGAVITGIGNAINLILPIAGGVTVAFFAIPVIRRLVSAFRRGL